MFSALGRITVKTSNLPVFLFTGTHCYGILKKLKFSNLGTEIPKNFVELSTSNAQLLAALENTM